MNKKAYISPEMTIMKISTCTLMAGSTGDINNVGVGTDEISGDDAGARRFNIWDDDED